MTTAEFEPTIPASERPQTYALGRAAIWIGCSDNYCYKAILSLWSYNSTYALRRSSGQTAKRKKGVSRNMFNTQTTGLRHCKGKLSKFF